MTRLPKLIRVDELFLEIRLTRRKHVVVEGNTDARFLEAWLQDVRGGSRVVVTPVENIEIPADGLFDLGLTDGNRSRVVFLAYSAEQKATDIRCVADRDCGHHVCENQYSTLLWTDYPAMESYSVDAKTLDRANLLSFNRRLPSGDELVPALTYALRELFAVRIAHPALSEPNYSGGLRNRRKLDGLSRFEVSRAVDPQLQQQVSSLPRPDSNDPREFSYGHDVAGLLLAAFGNELKNGAGLRSREAVENALRAAIQAVGAFIEEPLFSSLAEWIAE